MARIDTVDARSKLKARHEPYWVKLLSGCHLGYRKMTPTSNGTWIARYRDASTGSREKRSLGEFDSLQPSQRFDAAKRAAEDWFKHLGMGGRSEAITVKEACANYVDHARLHNGDSAAEDIKARFDRWVYSNEKFSSIELTKLRKEHVDAWRRLLSKTRVQINKSPQKEAIHRERSPSTVNRDMTPLRAALNHAYDSGLVTNDLAWRVALRPIKNADKRRDAYLDREQRRLLINQVPSDLAAFLTGLALVPLRPGALAAFQVKHFDSRLQVLTVGKDKAGRDRKIKLPQHTASFFEQQTRAKSSEEPLFARQDRKAWDKDAWKKPVKAAVTALGLPSSITTYALRHSAITDLVTAGLDLLTVAQLSGTSVAMIEKHYGHLRADHAAAALAKLAI